MNFPTAAFLITHATSGRKLLFDLGCQKDFWNLPPPIASVIDAKVPGIRVDKNLSEVLLEGGTELQSIEAAVISHHHYDHTGDPSTFPSSMELLVGPHFTDMFLPGYPTVDSSPLFEKAFSGRKITELDFSAGLTVAGYPAVDYFRDGSFYILNTPGHAIGHISGLVRTTADTFIFLGADICHFGGSFRPTSQLPMPDHVTPSDLCRDEAEAASQTIDTSRFLCLHPRHGTKESKTTPFYEPCSREDSWYVDPPQAQASIGKLQLVDADDRILVLIAHDPAAMRSLPLYPSGTLDSWYEQGWKEKLRWSFLDELPEEKGRPRPYLVEGTYMHGRLVKKLDGTKVKHSEEF